MSLGERGLLGHDAQRLVLPVLARYVQAQIVLLDLTVRGGTNSGRFRGARRPPPL